MKSTLLAAAVVAAGISAAPAFATEYYYPGYGRYYGAYEPDFRHDPEIRRDLWEIRRDKERLRREFREHRYGADNRWEIEQARRELYRDRMELQRDLARRRGW
jgi:hypothetical protein